MANAVSNTLRRADAVATRLESVIALLTEDYPAIAERLRCDEFLRPVLEAYYKTRDGEDA
jgi:hypothetical protein